jgi:acetyl-CoA synthetase
LQIGRVLGTNAATVDGRCNGEEYVVAPGKVDEKWFEDGTLNVSASAWIVTLKPASGGSCREPDDQTRRTRCIVQWLSPFKMTQLLQTLGVTRRPRRHLYADDPRAAYAMLACTHRLCLHRVRGLLLVPVCINGVSAKVVTAVRPIGVKATDQTQIKALREQEQIKCRY